MRRDCSALLAALVVLAAAVPAVAATSSGIDTPTTSTPLPFAVGGTQMMTLTSTGLGVKTTDPAYAFDVTGDTRILGSVGVGGVPNGSNMLTVYGNTYVGGGLSVAGAATIAGNVIATGYFHSSDLRLKKDVRTVAGLTVIEQLRGVKFRWKEDGAESSGVLAQDVERVMPTAVRVDGRGYKAVDYDQLIGPMIEAIKELKAENNRMAAEIDALKKRHAP